MDRHVIGPDDTSSRLGPTAHPVRALRHRGLQLLPGVMLLFGVEALVAQSGALTHLQPSEQAVFALSLLSIVISTVLLTIGCFARSLERDPPDAGDTLSLLATLLLAGIAAFGGALAGDYFLAASRLSGSAGIGGLTGLAVLLLVCTTSM